MQPAEFSGSSSAAAAESGGGSTKRVRVLLIHTHPVQYLAPLFRRYAESAAIDLTVAFVRGSEGGMFDRDFQQDTHWGIDLLGGYEHLPLADGRGHGSHRRVWRVIRRGNFDVVVVYGYAYSAAWVSLVAAKVARSKWVLVADTHKLESQSGARRPGKRLFLRVLGRVVDGIIAQSVRAERFYRGFAGDKVRLVPHAVDSDWFRSVAEVSERGQRERTVFLFVGKLIARKRVVDLLDAARAVSAAELWIAGSGPELPSLQQQASKFADRVRFLGFCDQSDLARIYADVDVVVLPSSIETFGLVVSEAASFGVPAIVSDACGVVESLVIHDETGIVYPSGDVGALAAAMQRMTDPALRSRLSRSLLARVVEWSPSQNVESFIAACIAFSGSDRSARD